MHGTTVPLDVGRQQSLARVEALARLMDGAFVLPGTTIRFGLDGIIGLIPVAGDMIAGLVSTYLIWDPWALKVSLAALPIRKRHDVAAHWRNVTAAHDEVD